MPLRGRDIYKDADYLRVRIQIYKNIGWHPIVFRVPTGKETYMNKNYYLSQAEHYPTERPHIIMEYRQCP